MRKSTAGQHAAVDRRFGSLFGGGLSGYRDFLHASALAVIPLERALTATGAGRLVPGWSERRREDALRQDLALLGSQAPAGPDVDGVGGEARQFGILYVLEGSRLGGKILARQAEAHSDPLIRTATHYLRHGENQSFWPSFLGALESSPAVRRAPEEAISGAQFAFGRFAGAGP